MTVYLGACGGAGSGKDTICTVLESLLDPLDLDVYRGSFAARLKRVLEEAYGWPVEAWEDRRWKESVCPRTGKIPRKEATDVGDYFRARDADIWVKRYAEDAEASGAPIALVSDVRFHNEADFVQARGLLFGRPERASTANAACVGHRSETESAALRPDIIVPWFSRDHYSEIRRFVAQNDKFRNFVAQF